jgi:hypothetical protein
VYKRAGRSFIFGGRVGWARPSCFRSDKSLLKRPAPQAPKSEFQIRLEAAFKARSDKAKAKAKEDALAKRAGVKGAKVAPKPQRKKKQKRPILAK